MMLKDELIKPLGHILYDFLLTKNYYKLGLVVHSDPYKLNIYVVGTALDDQSIHFSLSINIEMMAVIIVDAKAVSTTAISIDNENWLDEIDSKIRSLYIWHRSKNGR